MELFLFSIATHLAINFFPFRQFLISPVKSQGSIFSRVFQKHAFLIIHCLYCCNVNFSAVASSILRKMYDFSNFGPHPAATMLRKPTRLPAVTS